MAADANFVLGSCTEVRCWNSGFGYE